MTYRLYLDETGDPGYPRFGSSQSGFCLVGCLLDDMENGQVTQAILQLKRSFHINQHTWLHRNKILGGRGEFSRMRKERKVEAFCKEVSKAVAVLPLRLFAVSIDKHEMAIVYPSGQIDPTLPTEPMELTITFMMERVVTAALQANCAVSEVVWEGVGIKEDGRRRVLFDRHLTGGTHYRTPLEFQQAFPEVTQRFVKKQSERPVPGLEVADWIARVFDAKGLSKTEYDEEFELYRPKIWMGENPGHPGETGFKTFPKDVHRTVLECPMDKYSA